MRAIVSLLITLVAAAVQGQQRRMDSDAYGSQYGATVKQGLERVRASLARYASLDSAVAAGYPAEVLQCLSDTSAGGMGFHHVNRSFVDTKLEVERPEILLYERLGNGTYQLNGVEYIVPFRLWPRDSIPPEIMGQKLKPSDGLKLWYLHMWVWNENPSGLFADWNPRVKCG